MADSSGRKASPRLDAADPIAVAATALAAGDVEMALTGYRRSLERGAAAEVTGWLGIAVCEARRRHWTAAEAALQAVLELAPDCGLARAYLGAVWLEQGAVAAALAELDAAVVLAPTDAVVRLKRAEALLRLGRLPEAAAECRQAAALPHPDAATRDYARALLIGIRRELAGSLPRAIPSPGSVAAQLLRGGRAWLARHARPQERQRALDGST